ncbi:MAG TPA: hypothetical protein VF257_01385 [Solirubrobacteraceae bacterium]
MASPLPPPRMPLRNGTHAIVVRTAADAGLQDHRRLYELNANHGPTLLLRDLVRVGLDLDAVRPAAALVHALDEIVREEQERGRDVVVDGVVHRTCRLCGVTLPLTAEHFYTRPGRRSPESRCQVCRRRQNVERQRARKARRSRRPRARAA